MKLNRKGVATAIVATGLTAGALAAAAWPSPQPAQHQRRRVDAEQAPISACGEGLTTWTAVGGSRSGSDRS